MQDLWKGKRMNKVEVKNFMKRIQSHYNDFIVDDFKISEWYSELSKYDSQDVSERLDKHLKSEEYGKFAPKLFNLTRYLVPSEDKDKKIVYNKECPKCGRIFTNETFDDHYDDCVLIASIERDMKNYFNITITRQELETYGKEKLYKTYNKYIDKMLNCELVTKDRKAILKNCYIKGV